MAEKQVPESFESSSFVTGNSPVVYDVNAVLGKNGTTGYIINDGAGDFSVQFSSDGISYGSKITLKIREKIDFTEATISIDSIKITWIADSAYRILVL